jgi:hypothetical protein
VKIVGVGKVKTQSIQPGQNLDKNSVIILRIIVIILKDILYKVAIEAVMGSTDMAIRKIDFDSRKLVRKMFCSY